MPPDAVFQGDVHNKAAEAGEKARDVAGKVKDAAQETLTQLRQSSSQAYQEGKKHVASFERNLEGMIQENPWKAVLIAAGAGLLVGVVWKITS